MDVALTVSKVLAVSALLLVALHVELEKVRIWTPPSM
jgi:hypothetical protein